jgi:SAM-dependent methyltransferase
VGENFLATTLASAANPLLQSWSWRGSWARHTGAAVRLQTECRFGNDYDELFARVAKNFRVISERNAKFLSWRFGQNPLHRELRIFRLEAENRLRGYAVVEFTGDGARMIDFLVEDHATDLRTLLAGVIRALRPKGICSVSVRANDHNPILPLLPAFGPTSLDTINSGIAIHASPAEEDRLVFDERNWFMTQADRDI